MKTPISFSLKKTLFAFFAITAISFSFTFLQNDPIAILDHPDIDSSEITAMTADAFGKSTGIKLMVKGDYEVAQFNIVRVPKSEDPVEVICRSPKYSDRAFSIVDDAKSGDVYYFENIRAKSPKMKSEEEWLKLNSLIVKIE